MQVLEPEGEVEFLSGEVAAGDEAKDGVLEIGGKLGEGVACVGAGDGVELIEAEVVVEGGEGRGGERDTSGEGGVEMGGEMFCVGVKHARCDGLEGGELGEAQILRDVESAGVDELLKAKAGLGLGDRPRGEVLILGTGSHDTTLLRLRWFTFVYLLDAGNARKSLFWEWLILPQKWYVDWRFFMRACGYKGFIWITGRFGETAVGGSRREWMGWNDCEEKQWMQCGSR